MDASGGGELSARFDGLRVLNGDGIDGGATARFRCRPTLHHRGSSSATARAARSLSCLSRARASSVIIDRLAVSLAACARTVPSCTVRRAGTTTADGDCAPRRGAQRKLIPKRPPTADAWVDGEWVLRPDRWLWLLGRWVRRSGGEVRALGDGAGVDGALYYAPSIWVDEHGAEIDPRRRSPLPPHRAKRCSPQGARPRRRGRNISSTLYAIAHGRRR